MGVHFATLSYGYGVGAVNWSPLLEPQACLDSVSDPLVSADFSDLLAEAGLRLVGTLFPQSKLQSQQHQREMAANQGSKWRLVAYNLLELLSTYSNDKQQKSHDVISQRLSGLLRSVCLGFSPLSCWKVSWSGVYLALLVD